MSFNIGDLVIGLNESAQGIRDKIGRIVKIDTNGWYKAEFGLFEGERRDHWFVRDTVRANNLEDKNWLVKPLER